MSRYIDFYLIGELVDSHGNVHYEDLKNLPTVDIPQWIPCSERLPDEEGEYLLLYDSYFMNGKFAERRMKVEDFIIKPTKHFYREKGSSARYIAWMPLPEPWKGEENEQIH